MVYKMCGLFYIQNILLCSAYFFLLLGKSNIFEHIISFKNTNQYRVRINIQRTASAIFYFWRDLLETQKSKHVLILWTPTPW